jgi:hypothetical protein
MKVLGIIALAALAFGVTFRSTVGCSDDTVVNGEGILEARRGEFVDLSDVELRRYLETGELPERVDRWLESSDSLRAT